MTLRPPSPSSRPPFPLTQPPSLPGRLRLLLAVAALSAGGVADARAEAAPPAADVSAFPQEKSANPEANGLLTLGARLSGKGDYATAEIAYRQILNRGDFSPADQKSALVALAHMFRRSGALTKSVAVYEKFLQLYPDDYRTPDAFLDLGRTLRDMGAYKIALTRFYSVINTTLKLNAQGFDHYSLLAKTAQFEIAQTYYESGDYAEAGKFFTRVRLLDLAPADRARAHFMAGCAEQRAGELAVAVTTLRAYLEQWPTDENVPEARYVLATSLDELKQPEEALGMTLELLNGEHTRNAADTRRWTYWQRRTGNQLANKFFQEGDTLDALRIYLCLVGLSSEPSWHLPVVYQTALCYERLFQVANAKKAYQTVIDGAVAKPGAPAPAPEVVELAGMAEWRMEDLGWRDGLNRRLTNVLAPGSVTPAPSKTGPEAGSAAAGPPSLPTPPSSPAS
jgi:tetratricopeptide (TPR) repeat protein